MPEPRFLVVRLGSLGDIVHTFPAVAALRETYPNAEIVWLTHPRWKLLVDSSSIASQVWTVETRSFYSLRKTFRRIPAASFEAAIDYQGLWKSASLPFFGGIRKRIGFSSHTIREPGVPILYTDRVRTGTTHVADQNGDLSLRAGAKQGVGAFTLQVSPNADSRVREILATHGIHRYVVLSPGGGWRSKYWPAERFGALCQKIHNSLGIQCILNCGPGDDGLIAAVLAASGDAQPLPYRSDLEQLMSVLHNALCVVGGDTGPLHLAVALGAPVVALFGPTDPARNGPYPVADRSAFNTKENIVLRSPNAIATYKRGDRYDPAMLEITVEHVFDAVRRQIGSAT
jgi:lipopolysaccharide heptosyltransferase I